MSAHLLDDIMTATMPLLRGDESVAMTYSGESSDFVRFNGATVRQAGSVTQRDLTVELVEGRRHASSTVALAGDPTLDRERAVVALRSLREQVALVPDDPFLAVHESDASSEDVRSGASPGPATVIAHLAAMAASQDLAGVYAAGRSETGFASSFGQRAWHSVETFGLDWSLHLGPDRAVSNLYAGTRWDEAAFARKADHATAQLAALSRPERRLPPGEYRAYLAPAAVRELTDLLSWDGFSVRAHRTRRTPLLRMVNEHIDLDPAIGLTEDHEQGLGPSFGPGGFVRPPRVELIDAGRYGESLVSPRSMQEYETPTNGADDDEAPRSLRMAPGTIPTEDALEHLGDGLCVGNLWYLNFSDRAACRATGMTRFATFWVEGGEIVAPVTPLRFDDTVFRLLGDRLAGLTDEAELILDSGSYRRRSLSSSALPGALVDGMRFTL